jgi:hypothetical protein
MYSQDRDFNYITVLVKWAYIPSKDAITRNVPSEVRRILVGPQATGPKKYPWIIEEVTDFLETSYFALIKPKEHKKGQGRVSPADGAIGVYKIKRSVSRETLNNTIKAISKFCEDWRKEGKYGTKIFSYEITLSRVVVFS